MPKKPYVVGYGKPPKAHRFKKGQSGNPKGRPKGARGLRSDLADELSSSVEISENGQTLKISRQRLLIKRLVLDASNGKQGAMNKLMDLIVATNGVEGEAPKSSASLTLEDEQILADFLARKTEPVGT